MTRQVFIRYAVALLAVIACLELRLLLNPFLGVNVPFITFFFGVMVAAWYGGFGPATTAARFTGAGHGRARTLLRIAYIEDVEPSAHDCCPLSAWARSTVVPP